tara:strand:+ start:13618 stop:14049 length:432 start_codon:yes stop_codon:yes gene_type:complete
MTFANTDPYDSYAKQYLASIGLSVSDLNAEILDKAVEFAPSKEGLEISFEKKDFPSLLAMEQRRREEISKLFAVERHKRLLGQDEFREKMELGIDLIQSERLLMSCKIVSDNFAQGMHSTKHFHVNDALSLSQCYFQIPVEIY